MIMKTDVSLQMLKILQAVNTTDQ